VGTDLTRIGEKARKEPELVFTSLYHHVTDVDNLRAGYDALPEDRAVGVDGVTKGEYGANLEENLQRLSGRLKRGGAIAPSRSAEPTSRSLAVRRVGRSASAVLKTR